MEKYHLLGWALLASWIPALAAADGPVTTVYFNTSAQVRSSCPPPVILVRHMGDGHEEVVEPLLDCDRQVRAEALRRVSVLVRPRGVERPTEETLSSFDRGSAPSMLAENVRELHPGLLTRLQQLSEALDGHPIEILSGYRPDAAITSRHHHGRALDLRVQGVARARVRDVAVGFEHSGVGWYPNSIFVHLDVRERATYWVDESGPGEPARYVANAQPPEPARDTPETVDSEAVEAAPLAEAFDPESEINAIERDTDAALSGIRIDTF